MGAPPPARLTRRALVLAGAGAAGCALPWQRTDPRAPLITPPVETRVSFGPVRLRIVLGQEGHPPLDAAVHNMLAEAGRSAGYMLELIDTAQFGGSSAADISRQLLVGVQAGLPPDGLLLLGRQAQTPRLRAMGLIQEVSGLMRAARTRLGAPSEAVERAHYVDGHWMAAPLYQRLIGHFVRPDAFAGQDPETATASWPALGEALTRTDAWGISPADTPDADAWCWSAIHAWGGALVDAGGAAVTLASGEAAAALEWLSGAFRGRTWPDRPDAAKDAAFAGGEGAYIYTEGSGAATSGGSLVTGPAGPAFRPRAVGGGAVWLLPRGAKADAMERLWEALWQPERQRQLWSAGGGFALPAFEGQWSDTTVAALPGQESVRRFRALLAFGGFVSDSGQAAKPTAASQAVEAGRLATRMVRVILAGRSIPETMAAAQRDAEAIYREHAFPEGYG